MRKFFRRFTFVFKFWKSVPFIKDFFLSNEVETYKKVLSGTLILGYALFPFDIIPDFILLLGIFDDVVVIGFIVERMIKWAPPSLKEKYRFHDRE
ncbi:YkvA family protein [Bacillus carboniphilus]|uniref:YkvA family protein n=1 Tax=Bacillus carboniphilus TaxID=86663 RepID=UPI0031E46CBE